MENLLILIGCGLLGLAIIPAAHALNDWMERDVHAERKMIVIALAFEVCLIWSLL